MLAVKANYNNGTIRWGQRPVISGMHEVMVVFSDIGEKQVDKSVQSESARSRIEAAIAEIQRSYSDIPSDLS